MPKGSYSKAKTECLVSIVVPAFNVALYIEECIRSVLAQTYSNIELIIINDGSTDETGHIIEKCLEGTSRATVYHTVNSGVSAARNLGIQKSTGDYLVFVDGDDFISSDYIDYMMGLVKLTKSDFCISLCCYRRKGENQVLDDKISVLDANEATALLLSPEVVVGCWNKIYKREVLISNNIKFCESLFYGEGLSFITDVSQAVSSVGVGKRKVYYYRKNNESSATTKFDMEKVYNGEKALIHIMEKMVLDSDLIKVMFCYHICLYRLGALVQVRANGLEKQYKKDCRRWLAFIRRNVFRFVFVKDLSVYRKLLLIGGSVSPYFIMRLDKIRRRKIIANSV